MIPSTTNDYNTNTTVVDYETDWIEIADELVSPFYREKQQTKMNCLYADKCWIDLKLFPVTKMTGALQPRLKMIYLLLQSDECSAAAHLENTSTTRLLTIQTKFVLNNKIDNHVTFDIISHNTDALHSNPQTQQFINNNDTNLIKSMEFFNAAEIVNTKFVHNRNSESEEDEDNYEAVLKENLNDLFYLKINELIDCEGGATKPVQSKLVMLNVKEKAIKQISTPTHANDNVLISRQCFCLYLNTKQSLAIICAQKLLINNNGRLMITLKEDKNFLVRIHNQLDRDVYLWPRISSNFIFENYVRNCDVINEKSKQQLKLEYLNELRRRHGRKKSKSPPKLEPPHSSPNNSIVYMHRVPAKSCLKFNYDFIGTDHFPIENINEQVFMMLAVMRETQLELSPNMCRLYESQFEISFEHDLTLKLNYLAGELEEASNVSNRFITDNYTDTLNPTNPTGSSTQFKFGLNIERLTLALNDDYKSRTCQTEILRLTSDQVCVCFQRDSVQPAQLEFSCSHLQLDNQMFDSEEQSPGVSLLTQKYDFPVIFMPRAAPPPLRSVRYQTFESDGPSSDTLEAFLSLKLKLLSTNKLKEVDLTIKPFEIYLEDYLIYNLTKLGIELLQIVTLDKKLHICPNQDYESISKELDTLIEPAIMLSRIRIGHVDALISLQTSVKIYLATYKMPVFFDELVVTGLPLAIMSSPQLVKLFTSHYLTSLLYRAGWLLGSLDLIGSPTAFIQQVSNGVCDFLQMPYRGLRLSGATGLLDGFSNGSLSLIRNLSAGTITSLTSFCSFVSRNMDILSFDPHHLARQEQLRHQFPDSLGDSLLQISSGFLISIMGAIGGLAEQPIQSVHNSDSFIKGVSKGLIGLVTKPVGAVAELVNQTGQGLLRITGVNRAPLSELRLQRRALNKEFSRFSISMAKCLCKFIQANGQTLNALNAWIEAVYTVEDESDSLNAYNLTGCYLILTDDILYIIDKNEDMLLRAFYIVQIELSIKSSGEKNLTQLIVTLHSQKVESFFNDLLIDYIQYQASGRSSRTHETTALCDDDMLCRFAKPQSININEFLNKVDYNSADYYRFANIDILSYLNCYNGLPCSCGSMLSSLALIKLKSILESNNNANENPTQTKETADKKQQKQFVYYVDPRLSANFISSFNILKRKLSNKGFQF